MRMLDSMLCIPQPVFLEKHGERPDLYGPFWISTTIVFLIAVVSNYIGWYNHGAKSGEAAWKYDTDKVTYAGVLFYGYVGVIGFAIWATLRWFKAPTSLAQIWCVYGTLCTNIQVFALLHTLLPQGMAWQSSFPCQSCAPSPAHLPAGCWCAYPPLRLGCLSCSTCDWWFLSTQGPSASWGRLMMSADTKKRVCVCVALCIPHRAVPLYIAMACCHAALGVALKLYFFRYASIKHT